MQKVFLAFNLIKTQYIQFDHHVGLHENVLLEKHMNLKLFFMGLNPTFTLAGLHYNFTTLYTTLIYVPLQTRIHQYHSSCV